MSYLSSNNIKVFPAVRRTGGADPFSRLMSESTITSIVNRLVDYDGFVITRSTQSNKQIASGVFEFSIFGYYVKIENVSSLISQFSSASNIYAYIDLDTSDTNPGQSNNLSYKQLIGQDVDSSYQGIKFESTEPQATSDRHILHILTKLNNVWVVPETSYLKFSKNTLALYDIDGGEI